MPAVEYFPEEITICYDPAGYGCVLEKTRRQRPFALRPA